MLGFLNKLIDSNQKELGRFSKIVSEINALEKKYEKYSDSKLSEIFQEFKKTYLDNPDLDKLLPEVYAAAREAAKRVLEQRMFDVQLMAAIALHEGKVAEQKTGEGKTLSAAPALFLNSITGKGVHLVTVNDYLSRLGCGWMGPVYHTLGVSCAVIVHEQAYMYDPEFKDPSKFDERLMHLRPITRREAYQADINYGTNNEFGFDYLRDNMVMSLKDQVQREHYFAIVDEVDSILIDEARTPLIISSPAQEPTQKYYQFAELIEKLSPATDFTIDEKQKSAQLTEHGIAKVEKILGVENLYEKDFSTLHHIEQALKARTLFIRDRDYVVKDGEVIIVDEFTGRLMPGRRYSEGLHQAIEAKENVPIQQESQTLATISFQNYFRMYTKLSGMTGTAATEAEELHKIYKLEVLVIPTNQPMIRVDNPDLIYKTVKAKYTAVAGEIESLNQKGQPVLVGTTSIEKNELLSELLKRKGISHAVLNAKNHEKEAEIISKAGEKGAVTVATNMAGRGVDIKLGDEVVELGGLFVIGTERHESRRIDNQLRGRSGRQGDPGASRFYISLEDDLMRIFGGEQVAKMMGFLKIPEDSPIEHPMVSKAIESSQKKVEGHNFDIRKTTVEYDDVMNQQRQIIYGIRKKVLKAAENPQEEGLRGDVLEKVDAEIDRIVAIYTQEGINFEKIVEEFTLIINFDPRSQEELGKELQKLFSVENIGGLLKKIARDIYGAREKEFGKEIVRQMEVFIYLQTIGTLWVEHLDTMDDLRMGIGLRSFGQRDPLIEYKKEAFDLFGKLVTNIDFEIVHRIYKLSVQGQPELTTQPIQAEERHPEIEIGVTEETKEIKAENQGRPVTEVLQSEGETTKITIERAGGIVSQQTLGSDGSIKSKKPGRNDPCHCGSGKKYKRCHYPN